MSEWWRYENLESGHPYDWTPGGRGNHPDDNLDFHLDLGAGRLRKGRLTIDHHGDVDIKMDLNTMTLYKFGDEVHPKSITSTWVDNEVHYRPEDEKWVFKRFPFPDNSIKSIISHHCLEHIGDGFLRLMDECYRVLEPKGRFRIIVPLFPSLVAVNDPDHKRFFTKETFNSFCGPTNSPFWSDSFAEPYTSCRFKLRDMFCSPAQEFQMHPNTFLSVDDLFQEPREMRVTLEK